LSERGQEEYALSRSVELEVMRKRFVELVESLSEAYLAAVSEGG
jgi:hypothetical protein